MPQPTVIHLVRHGEVHNPDHVLYGRLPGFRLSARGRGQAQAAGEALRGRPLAGLYSSPQPRAQETASYIHAHHTGLDLTVDARIDEIYTPYEGEPLTIFDQPGFDLYAGIQPPYEGPYDLLRRAQDFIAHLRAWHSGQEVAAVTHGDIIAFVFLAAHGFPPEAQHKRRLAEIGLPEAYPATASISTFTYYSADPDETPTYHYQRPY
jgi:broad specificity phosphatase PhoE